MSRLAPWSGLSAAVGGWIMVRWIPAASADESCLVGDCPGSRGHRYSSARCLAPSSGLSSPKRRVPSFIVTLGMLMIGQKPHAGRDSGAADTGHAAWHQIVWSGPMGAVAACRSGSAAYGEFGVDFRSLFVWFPIQNIVWVAAQSSMLAGWFLIGAHGVRQKGLCRWRSNRTVAMLSGIRADRVKTQCLDDCRIHGLAGGYRQRISSRGRFAEHGRGSRV